MINGEYSYPVYVVTSGIATSGHLADIAPGQLGLFSRNNYSIVSNPTLREEIFFAFGSTRKFDTVGDVSGLKLPEKSAFFKIKDALNFQYSNPQKETLSNKVSVGFSGGSCSEGIKYECDKNYVLKLYLTGSPVLRYMGKPLEKIISYNTGCCAGDDCISCPDDTVDCEKHTKAIVELLNNEVELKQLGIKAMYVSDTYTATVPNMTKYCLEICDNGDTPALQMIQASVGKLGIVEKVGRVDCKTQYRYCGELQAPDITPTQSVALAICGVCQPGFTLVPAKDTYTVVRPLAGTEDLTTDAAKLAYATLVASTYGGTNPVYGSQNGATAFVSFTVPVDTVISALLADTLIKGVTTEESCTPTVAATPITWVACGTAYKVKRTLSITLPRTECAAGNRLAELQAFYLNNPEVVVGSIILLPGSVGCEDCYEIGQWSNGCMSDDCLASDAGVFNTLTSFEGQLWEVKEPVTVPNLSRKCGFTIEFNLPEIVFSNCSFDPNDFYEDEPTHLEVGWELSYPNTCSLDQLPKIKNIREEKFRRQSGEWVIRQLINWSAYHWASPYACNPRLREALGQEVLSQVDRNAFYKVYYVKFIESRPGINTFAEQPRIFEPLVIFKENDPNALVFERMYSGVISSQSIVLSKREDLLNW